MRDVVIVSAARTPFGRFGGGLKPLKAVDLGGLAVREALLRANIDGALVDEVILGMVVPAGQGQIPGRQAAIKGGVPHEGTLKYADYLVVGDGGRESKGYKHMKKMIDAGGTIELTEANLRDICNGLMPLPIPISGPDIIIVPANEEGQRAELIDTQRKAFAEKYKNALTQYER